MVNGVCSEWTNVTSGIPQGSVLGPILFTIFINDLPISISSHVKIFADDTKLYNTTENTTVLQDDLHKLYEWSNKWLLPFNIDKCSILHYGKHNNMYNYCLNNYRINVDCFIKDLGVTFQDDLKFGQHIKKIVLNANSKLGIIRNTFHNLSKKTSLFYINHLFVQFWNIAVLFGHLIFSCITKKLKKIQRRATKLVKSATKLPYCDRLKMLGFTTLYYRRLRADVIQVYRIINNIDKLELSKKNSF